MCSVMKETAEAYLGGKLNDAVITVLAYSNDSQCEATKTEWLEILEAFAELPTMAPWRYDIKGDAMTDEWHAHALVPIMVQICCIGAA